MNRLPIIALAALIVLSLASCGDEATDATTGDPTVAATRISVCGEGGVGFLVRSSGGGLIPFGARVLFELGSYVAVDRSCRFVMSRGNGVVLGGTLSSAQADKLSRFLALGEWGTLAQEYSRSCWTHIGPTSFRWGERRLELYPCSQLPPQPADFRHDLLALPLELGELLEPWSEPLDGPMRYVLVDNSEAYEGIDFVAPFQNAPLWPLGDPSTVAVVESFDGLGPPVEVAMDDDAMRLRAIRNAWAKEEIGSRYSSFAPVVGPDGRRYELYVRDVAIGFETDGGLTVPWLTEGRLHVTAVVFAEASRIEFTVFCGDSTNPFTSGALEDTGGNDERYWRGEIEGVPGGICRVELNATAQNGNSLTCTQWLEVGGTDSPTIRSGWINNATFRCDP